MTITPLRALAVTTAAASLLLSSCSTYYRPLDKFVNESAQLAKNANADTYKAELQVVYGATAGLTAPIPFVPVSLTFSNTRTDKVTVEIKDLQNWSPRSVPYLTAGAPDGLYRIDQVGNARIIPSTRTR